MALATYRNMTGSWPSKSFEDTKPLPITEEVNAQLKAMRREWLNSHKQEPQKSAVPLPAKKTLKDLINSRKQEPQISAARLEAATHFIDDLMNWNTKDQQQGAVPSPGQTSLIDLIMPRKKDPQHA